MVFPLFALLGCGSPTVPPTWSADVAPILAERCASCHQDGALGPMPLTDYAHAAPFAMAIAAKTSARAMPPWLADASGECGEYQDSEWLSDDAIATLGAWADAGAPAGDATVIAAAPVVEDLDGRTIDLDIGADYVPVLVPDDNRCFIADPSFTSRQFVTAYQVFPGDAAIVHHMIAYALDDEAAEARVDARDADDDLPGFACLGSPDIAAHPLAAWAPGTPPTVYPEGTGIRVDAGRRIVLQMHYNALAGEGPDRTVVRFRVADSVPNEAINLPLGDLGMRLPPGMAAATNTTDFRMADLDLPIGFFVRAAFPHMHARGRTLRLDVVRADSSRCVVDVPRWDFAWQRMYLYERAQYVFPTDTLRLTCTFDTTADSDIVWWGEGTGDEMCLLGLLVTAAP